MYHNEKRTEKIELPNQEGIRTFEEKENYKYQGIFEENIFKQIDMIEKERKKLPLRNNQNIPKPNSSVEIL